jgi:hypothetical protein
VSVAIEDGDSREAVGDLVLETIKNAMDNGELLSENTPEVEKVQYIGKFDDTFPTQSVLPTTAPSLQVADTPTATPSINVVEKIQCPGEYSECDTASDDNVVQVFFRYTIETSPDVLNPDTNLPALEEKLLEKLAPVMLAHCIVDGDARSLTTISHNNHYHPYKRRKLNTVRRLLPTGICSIPADEHLIEGASFILHIVRFSSFPLQPISLYSFST